MDPQVLKAAAAAIHATLGLSFDKLAGYRKPYRKPRTIQRLLEAKSESDRRNYGAKASIMKSLFDEHPEHFHIDSEDRGIVGVTHHPSGFRMHLPKTAVPLTIKKLKQVP